MAKLTKQEFDDALHALLKELKQTDAEHRDDALFALKQVFDLCKRYNIEQGNCDADGNPLKPPPQFLLDLIENDLRGPQYLVKVKQLIQERFGK